MSAQGGVRVVLAAVVVALASLLAVQPVRGQRCVSTCRDEKCPERTFLPVCPKPGGPKKKRIGDEKVPTATPVVPPPSQPAPAPPTASPPAGMVRVPAGCFQMGSTTGDDDEKPVRQVCLDAFDIDEREVTNEEYGRCVAAGVCGDVSKVQAGFANGPYNQPRQPVVGVTWFEAAQFCAYAKKDLPTEAEWEYAARGKDGRKYPWGNSVDCGAANYGAWEGKGECASINPGRPKAVGTTPRDVSPFGVLDLGGNVLEWVRDWYSADFYGRSGKKNPVNDEKKEDQKVVRGGALSLDAVNLRSADRFRDAPSVRVR